MEKHVTEHPSRDELRDWLRGEELAGMDHVQDCDQCLTDLEELSRLDDILVHTFALVTRPSPGFAERVIAAIQRRERQAETWSVVTDLFSLSWRTIDTVWNEDG